jgi:hypothetical protein
MLGFICVGDAVPFYNESKDTGIGKLQICKTDNGFCLSFVFPHQPG